MNEQAVYDRLLKIEIQLSDMKQDFEEVKTVRSEFRAKLDMLTGLPIQVGRIEASVGALNGRVTLVEAWKERLIGGMAVVVLIMGSGIVGYIVKGG